MLWAIPIALGVICWLLFWILARLANIHKTLVARFQRDSKDGDQEAANLLGYLVHEAAEQQRVQGEEKEK
jgi:hypothetical protein